MILTLIPDDLLPATLAAFAKALVTEPGHAALSRLADPAMAARASGDAHIKNHRDSIDLAASFKIPYQPGSPRLDFSWNGQSLRRDTEAYVLLHEVAHWQLAAPARRSVVDFGLGAGPETGDREAAIRAQCVFGLALETEEALASLLGILWEAELGHPALASFLDQNWLEGAMEPARLPRAAAHFERILGMLIADGFADRQGRPLRHRRETPAHLDTFGVDAA